MLKKRQSLLSKFWDQSSLIQVIPVCFFVCFCLIFFFLPFWMIVKKFLFYLFYLFLCNFLTTSALRSVASKWNGSTHSVWKLQDLLTETFPLSHDSLGTYGKAINTGHKKKSELIKNIKIKKFNCKEKGVLLNVNTIVDKIKHHYQ